jgi:hypothetical protein
MPRLCLLFVLPFLLAALAFLFLEILLRLTILKRFP